MEPCWDPDKTQCHTCHTTLISIADDGQEYVLWCSCCGALFTGNKFKALEQGIWRDPEPIWRSTDPRYSINKRADIVILRPGGFGAGTAQVDTKEGWWIFTDYKDHRSIEDWDQDWLWTWAPEKKRSHGP